MIPIRNNEIEPESPPHDWIIQAITSNQQMGNALASAIGGGVGESHTFDDDNALCLVKDGQPAWATETVARESKKLLAAQYESGVNPPELGLSPGQFAAARSVVTVRTGTRDIQYTLREWVESLGYTVIIRSE